MPRPPTAGSLSIAVFTRVVIVVSSIVSPMVLPHPATSGTTRIVARSDLFQQPRFRITALHAEADCNLHARDVKSRVDHQHLAGDATCGVAEKKCRRFTHFTRFDVAAKRRPVAVHAEDAGEPGYPGRGKCFHRAGGNRVHADVARTDVRGEVTDCGFK